MGVSTSRSGQGRAEAPRGATVGVLTEVPGRFEFTICEGRQGWDSTLVNAWGNGEIVGWAQPTDGPGSVTISASMTAARQIIGVLERYREDGGWSFVVLVGDLG